MDALRLPIGKSCSKCGHWKLLDAFHRDSSGGRLGHKPHCKECQRHQRREYYERTKEEHREQALAKYYANKARYLENNRRWREANPERIKEYQERYKIERPHYKRDYYKRNPDKMRRKDRRAMGYKY